MWLKTYIFVQLNLTEFRRIEQWRVDHVKFGVISLILVFILSNYILDECCHIALHFRVLSTLKILHMRTRYLSYFCSAAYWNDSHKVSTYNPGDWGSIQAWVIPKTFKIILDSPSLNTQLYKVRIKGKWSNRVTSIAPSHYCSVEKLLKRKLSCRLRL